MNDNRNEKLEALVRMSAELGRPENDYSILAEGNTSTQTGTDEFYVKASGYSLRDITLAGFVAVQLEAALDLLDQPLADLQLPTLERIKVDQSDSKRPSVEVILHALLLTLGGAQFIGHTHPSALNSLLCSQNAEQVVNGRIFPDEVVLCGPESVYVPYTDPGLPLAREVRSRTQRFIDKHNMPPKVILLQSHGLIALGQTAREVEQITMMAVKAARIMLGTFAAGGPRFLSEAEIAHLWRRPDEIYRRAILK